MKCAFLDATTHKHRRQCHVSLYWRAPLKKNTFFDVHSTHRIDYRWFSVMTTCAPIETEATLRFTYMKPAPEAAQSSSKWPTQWYVGWSEKCLIF